MKVLLGDYFDTGRLPPAEVVAAVRHQSWRDLEYKGGSLDVVGGYHRTPEDRLAEPFSGRRALLATRWPPVERRPRRS